jgi:hypothetical protein
VHFAPSGDKPNSGKSVKLKKKLCFQNQQFSLTNDPRFFCKDLQVKQAFEKPVPTLLSASFPIKPRLRVAIFLSQ